MPKNNTPMLPGFQCENRGRRRLSSNAKFRRIKEKMDRLKLREYEYFFSDVFSDSSLLEKGANYRDRIYSKSIVFWAFFVQVMSKGSTCQEMVFMIQNWLTKKNTSRIISKNTAGYVKARARLKVDELNTIFTHIRDTIMNKKKNLWYGHRVKVVDGTGLSMPDTPQNQEKWPQSKSQAEGCGFPLLNLCGVFCLMTGTILDWGTGNKHESELTIWSRLWKNLTKGDLIVGDRGFFGYGMICLNKQRGIDHLVRIKSTLKIDWSKAKKIGHNDWLYALKKTSSPSKLMSKEEWESLPSEFTVRLVKCRIYDDGFRGHTVLLVTTLTDSKLYPLEELGKLYQKRWDVEINFSHMKESMGMGILSCKKPGMIEKEITMYMISYNLVRGKMLLSAIDSGDKLERISYKGVTQALRQELSILLGNSYQETCSIRDRFLSKLTQCLLPKRAKPRVEPRARKRRPKRFKLLTKARQILRNEILKKWDEKLVTEMF